MKYTRQGEGDFLILVHGALTDGSMWHNHLTQLATHFDVISVTLRRFDEEDIGDFGLNTHAEDLLELLNQLTQQKPVSVVGWSYGADVVLNALAKQDLPLAKAFLYEPGYPGCLQESEIGSWQLDAESMFGPVFTEFGAGNLELAVESLIDGSGNSKGYFQAQPKSVRELQLAKSHTLAHQLNQKEQPAINVDTVSKIRVPIILGYGENTRELFKSVTVRTSQLLNNAELKEVPRESHMLPQENPQEFSKLILSILSS